MCCIEVVTAAEHFALAMSVLLSHNSMADTGTLQIFFWGRNTGMTQGWLRLFMVNKTKKKVLTHLSFQPLEFRAERWNAATCFDLFVFFFLHKAWWDITGWHGGIAPGSCLDHQLRVLAMAMFYLSFLQVLWFPSTSHEHAHRRLKVWVNECVSVLDTLW